MAAALQKFFAVHLPRGGSRVAYVSIPSSKRLDRVAERLSEIFGIRFIKSDDFDECEAFVGFCDSYDVTVLYSPLDEGHEEKGFELMVEPGHDCEDAGMPLDLTEPLCDWLNAAEAEFKAVRL